MSAFTVKVIAPATAFVDDVVRLAVELTADLGEGSVPVDPSSLVVKAGKVGVQPRAYSIADPLALELRHVSTGAYLLTVPADVAGQFAWAVSAENVGSGETNDGGIAYVEGRYSVLPKVFG